MPESEGGSEQGGNTKVVLETTSWGFPGCPGVKTSPSNAGGAGSISSRGAKIPHALQPKNQNRSNIVANSKTLKMVHIKKKS